MVRFIVAAAITTVCVFAHTATADQVRLKNGDTITGIVNYYDGAVIHVDVEYLEEDLVLKLTDLAGFESEKPLVFRLKDGSEIEGRLRMTESGDLVIVDASGNQVPFETSNLIEAEPPTDWFRYSGSANIGIAIASGNTDTQTFHVDGAVQPMFGRNTFRLGGQLNRAEADNERTASNWRLLAEYERELTYRWFAFATNQYDNDDLLGLNVRVTAGGGLGYWIFREAPRHLRIQLGPAYVHENWQRPTPDEDYAAARWALNFDHEIFSPDLVFYHNHVYLQSLQEGKRFSVQTTTGLRYDLIWDLFGSLEVQWDWNNQPADNAQEDDTRFFFKLGYAF